MRSPQLLATAAALAGLAAFSSLAQSVPAPSGPVVTSLTLFAGAHDGLWQTRDWGATWRPAESRTSGASLRGLSEVRAILATGSRVYAGGNGGLFVSDDFGLTWAHLAPDESVFAVLPSRYAEADPTLFLGTARGLLRSVDAGRTFAETPLSGTTVFRLVWPGPALVAATGRGVFVSIDAGVSFLPAGQGLPEGDVRALALSSFFQLDPVLFAAVKGRGVYRSSDGGKTWQAAGLEGRDVNDLVWLGPILYAATDAGVRRSEDLGRSWTPLDSGLAGGVSRLLFPLMPDSGAVVFAATDQGVFRSDDGGSNWHASGMKDKAVLEVSTFPAPDRAPRKLRR